MPMGLHLGLGLGNPPQGIALEAETQAYLAAMISQPSDAMKEIYNNLIKGLKGDGVWAKLDYLQAYYTAHNSWQDTLINMINPAQKGASIDDGTPTTFEVKKGFTVSSTRTIDTSHNPSQANTKMLYNDLFVMLACHSVPAASSNYEFYISDGTNTGIIALRSTHNPVMSPTYDSYFGYAANPFIVDLGWENKKWYVGNRLSATANTQFYCCESDANYLSSESIPRANGIPNITSGTYRTVIFGRQVQSDGSLSTNRRITYPAYYVAGAGLTFTQFAALKARIQAYETAMGAL